MSAAVERLFLVRHACPEGDVHLRYLGRTDPGLGDLGREQARALGRSLPEAVGLPVWSSPLRRARETAELAFPGAEVRIEPLAVEISFGVVDGLLRDQAERLYPEACEHLRRRPLDAAPVGGESWPDLLSRARELAPTLGGAPGMILVSHICFLVALVRTLAGPAAVPPDGFGHAACLVLERSGPGEPWRARTGA